MPTRSSARPSGTPLFVATWWFPSNATDATEPSEAELQVGARVLLRDGLGGQDDLLRHLQLDEIGHAPALSDQAGQRDRRGGHGRTVGDGGLEDGLVGRDVSD